MKKNYLILLLFLALSSFDKANERSRLVFEEEISMRSSFCMYSDGKFYETRPSGCVGQDFASGSWKNINDTVTLIYNSDNLFNFEVLKSHDTTSKYQIVRILDCYNQPVRFQNVCFDTICQNLYNPAILRIEKEKSISYLAPIFDDNKVSNESVFCNADTITFKWNCNRESIESINGGSLYINREPAHKRIVLKNKRFVTLQ